MAQTGFLFSLPESLFDNARLVGEAGPAEPGGRSAPDAQADGQQQPGPSGQQQPEAPAAAAPAAEGQPPQAAPAAALAAAGAPAWNEAGATCIACGIGVSGPGFASAAEQRRHFKTDWHRYNVKRRLSKKPPVTEDQFGTLLEEEGDLSSISGSDTDDSSSDEDDGGGGSGGEEGAGEGAAAGARGGGGGGGGGGAAARRARRRREAGGQAPQLAFQPQEGSPLAVWRCLLYPDHHSKARPTDSELLSGLRRLRRGGPATWAVLLARGGHFAGAVFRLRAGPPGKGQHGGDPFEVVAHKTFHRYVVRAKAGGKQSSKDASGKYAKSAGSALRRYNEGALQRDAAELMAEWRPLLDGTDLIFVHAPSSNAKLVFGAGAAGDRAAPGERWALDPGDARVRRVPFVTRRPTFSELRRVLLLLGGVMAARAAAGGGDAGGEEEEGAADEAGAGGQRAAAAAVAAARQQAAEDAGGGEAAAEAEAPGAGSPAGAGRKKAEDPPLIKAARAGDAERVARLLEGGGHDPAAADAQGRTAYQLAANKEARA
ncbi:MAG: hypothetical protein J3K34DRAFT_499380 [Monoraphidium minutum]|nr:MAG: hypothetical protein J3K34DRAFT_499380 [Monoraphidium minutum]